MRNRIVTIGAGLIALLRLGGVAAFSVPLQVHGNPLPILLGLMAQRQAGSQACQTPASLVPGSYQADPMQTMGDWVVVTYAAEWDAPCQPRRAVGGYTADERHGGGCGGSGSRQPITLSASGSPVIYLEEASQCRGNGGPGGLSVVTGYVSGAGIISGPVLFAAGATTSAPIRGGRFAIVAPIGQGLCAVRAVDAGGAVLAETKLSELGYLGCP